MAIKLKPDEEAWLEDFRKALQENYPGRIEEMVIFRSQDGRFYLPDYTLNTVVILNEGDRKAIKDINFLGHYLSVLSEAIPFVWVYTREEWKNHRLNGYLPYRGDGTSVWPNQS